MARRAATAEDLKRKPRRSKTLDIPIGDDVVTVKLLALRPQEYDDLLSEHPPTKEQKAAGGTYNPDTFNPALIAACLVEPQLSAEEVLEIWEGGDWSRGELSDLTMAVLTVNNGRFDVSFPEGPTS